MELTFKSDFSIQRSGFRARFQHVAVAMRNQKVRVTNGNEAARTTESVSFPTLSELTVCLEAQRTSNNRPNEWLFRYLAPGGAVALALGAESSSMLLLVDGVRCPLGAMLTPGDLAVAMATVCLTWAAAGGRLAVYQGGRYRAGTCPESQGHALPAGGELRLGGVKGHGSRAVLQGGRYRAGTCPESQGHALPAGGELRLG
ncbi:adhesion G-protein coupled receptor G6-like, partial [Menidia menidia]